MHPQGDFDADLRRLRQMERPDRVSGLLNSMHVTDTSAKIRLRARLVGSAERTISAILSMARAASVKVELIEPPVVKTEEPAI